MSILSDLQRVGKFLIWLELIFSILFFFISYETFESANDFGVVYKSFSKEVIKSSAILGFIGSIFIFLKSLIEIIGIGRFITL
ncbi:hypothetical protein ACKWTF_010397 [Chironomus riparius]